MGSDESDRSDKSDRGGYDGNAIVSRADGIITSEGVMGLQRGFKKAGVQSIVMSLWKVADRPTQEFMTEFYRHLTAGEGKRASFLAAQRFLKEKYPTNLPNDDGRPPYWASFIILDPEVR